MRDRNLDAPAPSQPGPLAELPAWRRNLTLGLILVVAALNYIDRQIFSIFLPQIGEDLGIDHQELGLIAGASFSVFYVLGAFPIARLADRGDRPRIIALCVAVWSLATAACAFAGSGLQLALIRIGLAAGEGGAGPTSQSLVLNLYPQERRTMVLAALLAASAVGVGAGGWIGGQLSEFLDWRGSLIAVGLPGLLVGAAVWLLAAEPRRSLGGITPPPQIPLRDVFRVIAASPSLRWTALAIVCVSTAGFPFVIWAGAFYQTVHGMSVKEAGTALFLPMTGGLVLGNLLAGWAGDRLGQGRPRFLAGLAAAGLVLAFPFGLGVAQLPAAGWSLFSYFVFKTLITLHLAPLQALSFAQVPPGMRAMLGATIGMIISLCGIGVGTWLVGALSSFFAGWYGDMSLRYALSWICGSILLGAFAAYMAGRAAQPLETPS